MTRSCFRTFTRACLVLMIALLPMRGWAAAVMSINPGALSHAAVVAVASFVADADSMDVGMAMPPCHEQQAVSTSPHTCATCDFCHSIALPSMPDLPRAFPAVASQPDPRGAPTPPDAPLHRLDEPPRR